MRGPRDTDGESDEPGTASSLQELLADLSNNNSASVSASRNNGSRVPTGQGSGSGHWLPSPRSSPARQGNLTRPYSYLTRRRSSTSRVVSVSSFDQSAGSTSSPGTVAAVAAASSGNAGGGTAASTVFPNPNRSIFASGQPTSSISVNTAHASMSAPPPARDSRPLAALSGSTVSSRRPTPQALQLPFSHSRHHHHHHQNHHSQQYYGHQNASSHNHHHHHHQISASVEKDADDPNLAMDEPSSTRRAPRTSTALSQLFVDDSMGSPTVSRHGSYLRTLSGTQFTKMRPFDNGALAPHVYGQGLLGGKFSDITVHAFGTSYSLHRLLLDRAPFFSTAFSGPWLEANSKEMKLDPVDVDPNITQAAFELALKRIYGCEDPEEEDQEAIGLFAVACWLEMDDLLEASIESLLRQMTPAKLSTYIRFVTGNYYGSAGTRILSSAKAMLCRDGWRMKLRCWDGIPADIIRDIISGDGFFIAGEWERWTLARRLLNRRLKRLAQDSGLFDEAQKARKLPKQFCTSAIRRGGSRFDEHAPTSQAWLSFYSDHDIVPLLQLLDNGIFYAHLSFEELQHIRGEKDVLGIPILPERVISSALWTQIELKQKIVNADDSELELGLAQQVDNVDATLIEASQNLESSEQAIQTSSTTDASTDAADEEDVTDYAVAEAPLSSKAAGKRPQSESVSAYDRPDILSESFLPQRFWVPTIDATFPVGVAVDDTNSKLNRASRGSRNSTARPEDVHWAGDVTSLTNAANESISHGMQMQHQLSHSPTSPRIATAPTTPVAYTNFPPFRFSVEFPAAAMLKENKRCYSDIIWYAGSLWNIYVQKKDSSKGLQLGVYLHREKQHENMEISLANYTAGHSVDERIGRLERELETRRRAERRGVIRDGDAEQALVSPSADSETMTASLNRPSRRSAKLDTLPSKGGSNPNPLLTSFPQPYDTEADDEGGAGSEVDSDEESGITSASLFGPNRGRPKTPALPPYIDRRPTIKTYFKIYTPGKDGRVLTVYESKPDRFNFSQSWGWKSGSLDLEGENALEDGKEARDRKLRFMVVLGTV